MAQDLGLHRDEITRTDDLSEFEQLEERAFLELKRRIWSACVIMDRWYAASMGMPQVRWTVLLSFFSFATRLRAELTLRLFSFLLPPPLLSYALRPCLACRSSTSSTVTFFSPIPTRSLSQIG